MKKISFVEVQNYIKEHDINHDCTLLSTEEEYQNSKTKMRFLCNSCNKEFLRSFCDLKRNSSFKCAVCAQGRRLTLKEVQDFIQKYDVKHECELLSTSYSNYNSKLKFKCNCCGSTFERNMSQLNQTKSFACYNCLKKRQGGANKLDIQKVRNFIKEYDVNHDCTLLSNEYINQMTPLLFKCNCCGKEYERTFQTMRAKKSFKCFRCAHHLLEDSTSPIYLSIISYFRGKTYLWKKDYLSNHSCCDITGETSELEIHHLTNFSSILQQASLNTGVPLIYKPQDLDKYGYSLDKLTKEFLLLHNQAPAVLLSKKCHQLFHKEYGYKNNTPDQYYEFKERYLNGEFN